MLLPPRFPDLEALDLFVSVVECGSLSQAARAHGISQPSGSARIDRLERCLGLRLLRRTPAGSVPTDNGVKVAAWARDLLGSAAGFHTAVDALRAGNGQRLRLAASYTIAEYVLPAWLSALAEDLPPVELSVANSTLVSERVGAGGVHLGFVEGATVPPRLERRTVGRDELVVVVAPGHPWARRRQPLRARELAGARLVMRERGSGTREVLEQLLAHHASTPPAMPLMELGSTTAVKAAVLDGSGPAVLSRLTVQAEIEARLLVAVPVEGIPLSRTLRVVWRGGDRLSRGAALLIRHATGAAFPETPGPTST
jgi:DNA-binding transcriptional LysR family regulator